MSTLLTVWFGGFRETFKVEWKVIKEGGAGLLRLIHVDVA